MKYLVFQIQLGTFQRRKKIEYEHHPKYFPSMMDMKKSILPFNFRRICLPLYYPVIFYMASPPSIVMVIHNPFANCFPYTTLNLLLYTIFLIFFFPPLILLDFLLLSIYMQFSWYFLSYAWPLWTLWYPW